MALQIRKGTDSQRQAIAFKSGELVYTTDYKDLFVGDGTTLGGIRIAPIKSINGLAGSAATGAVTLNSDNITQGATNKYYNSTTARIDAGAALVGGNNGSVGISFAYRTDSNTITATVTAGGYSLPAATPTDLGGVKISQGGLAIDGAGLLSVTTPVSAGVTSQLSYYTGTNAVGAVGTGLTWSPTNIGVPGGVLSVTGQINSTTVEINTTTASGGQGGFFVNTENDGNATSEVFAISSTHNSSTATTMRFFRSRGTLAARSTVQSGDDIIKMAFFGITGASSAGLAAQITATAVGTISSGIAPGRLTLSTADGAGTLVPTLQLDSGGLRTPGFIKVGQVSGTLPNPAEAGMIVLDGTTFKGYNGSAWVNLN